MRNIIFIIVIVSNLIIQEALSAKNLVFLNENRDYLYSFDMKSDIFRYYKVIYQDTNAIIGKFLYEGGVTWNSVGMKIDKVKCSAVNLAFGIGKSTSEGNSHIYLAGVEESRIDSLIFYNSYSTDSFTIIPANNSAADSINKHFSYTAYSLPFKTDAFKVYRGNDRTDVLRFSELNLNKKRNYKTGLGRQIMLVERSLMFQDYKHSYKDIWMEFSNSETSELNYMWWKPGVLKLAVQAKARYRSKSGIIPSTPINSEEKDSILTIDTRRFIQFGDL